MIPSIMAVGAYLLLCTHLQAQSIRRSVQSGNWSNKNTWDCNCVPTSADHAIVVSGHVVTFLSTNSITNLTIEEGATLTDNGLANTISGNLEVNGTYSGSGTIALTGENTTLNGTGTISSTGVIQVTGNKTIQPTANLTINSATVTIDGPLIITNQGTITIGGNINGSVAGSTWVNGENSTLNIGGSSGVPLLATGTLYAHAAGNTINYYGTYAHTLKLPATVLGYSTYHHLKISGSNTKTLPNGDVAVNGDLTINSTFSGSGSSKKLFLRGNWINNGNFTEGTGQGTVTFDGATDQYISRAATENMNVVVINKTAGKVILNTNLIAERGLTMIGGDIDVRSYKLTLGLSPAIVGTFSWTSGKIMGKFERWVATTGVSILFPIGTSKDDRPVAIQFNSLTPGSLLAEFITSSPGNTGLPLTENGVTLYNTFRDGYWSLQTANLLASNDFNLDVSGNGFTGFPITDNTRLLAREAATNPWSLNGTHLDRIGNTIRRTTMSVLSGHYALGDDSDCNPPATTSIIGKSDVCREAMGEVYTVTNNSPNTYAWTVSGGVISSGDGSNSITVNWGTTGLIGKVSVIEKNTCTEGAEVSLAVNVHALPPASLTGKTSVPENGITPEGYSVPLTTDYLYSWTVTGGNITSGQGTNAITVTWGNAGVASVCVTADHSPVLPSVSCGQSVSTCGAIHIYKVISSVKSGNWQTKGNWDCNCVPAASDNVTIKNTHTISLSGGGEIINHVNINAGGAININSNTLTVNGDMAVNGILSGTGTVELNGANTYLDGVGVITQSGPINITANKVIPGSATLTKNSGAITLSAGVVVQNQGTFTLGGNLVGSDNTSQWINASNATLNSGGELLSTGKLYASSPGNTIRYYGSAAQIITTPDSQQYTHLLISGTGPKTAPAGTIHISGDFTNDGNFLHNNGTIDFNGDTQVTGTSAITFHHVSLNTGSALSFPPEIIQVTGDMEFEPGSTFESSGGTVSLNGSSLQNLDMNGASFHTLNIVKAGGSVNINSEASITRLLDVQTTTPLNTNDQLIIRSKGITTDQDGSIGPLPADNLVSGEVKVERYMNPMGNTFRYVASPVEDALPPAQFGSGIYEYTYASGNGTWTKQLNTNPLEIGKGYSVLMPGGASPITWSVKGAIHQGAYTWSFIEEGWHLLGNPYPSAIRWYDDNAAWQLTNVSTTIAVTDNSVSGYPNYFRYWSYEAEDYPDDWGEGAMANGIVSMGQAFWVYVGEGGGSLTVFEEAKESSLVGRFYREKSNDQTVLLKITIDNAERADVAFLKLVRGASRDYDFRYDVKKLKNDEMNISLVDVEQNELVINAIEQMEDKMKIPLAIEVQEPGRYTLSFSSHGTFSDLQDILLVDKQEETTTRISGDIRYDFMIMNDGKSAYDRFYLVRDQAFLKEDFPRESKVFPNPVKDILTIQLPEEERATFILSDSHGRELTSRPLQGTSRVDLQDYPKGIYIVRLFTTSGMEIYRIIR